MLRDRLHDKPVSTLWFWPTEQVGDDLSAWGPCSAACAIVWERPDAAWIFGLHGNLTRGNMRELMAFCIAQGVNTIKAYRRGAHRLPGSVKVGDHDEIDLRALKVRVG